MKWMKLGNVFAPDKNIWWQQYYGYLPTPIHIPEKKIIRVYYASTCINKFGRISFIDVNDENPTQVINRLDDFILDIGELGSFDDCGVAPSSILRIGNRWLLYYAGYQRHFKTPYSILSGLAHSTDGIHFTRIKKVPILERTDTELSLRSAPTVLSESGSFKMWYVGDYGWKKINSTLFADKLLPLYNLKYGISDNGVDWNTFNEPIFKPENDEFGFGRPYIFKQDSQYQLFYSVRRENTSYRIGYAESIDGKNWTRKDQMIGIDVSDSGWDSEMICYPAVLKVNGKTYLFYNGNNNGETGFGVAQLVEE